MSDITVYWIDLNRFDKKPDKSTLIEISNALGKNNFHVNILTGYGKKKYRNASGLFNIIYFKAYDAGCLFRISLLMKILLWLTKNGSRDSIYVLHPNSLYIVPLLWILGKNKIHLDIRTVPVEIHSIKDVLDKFLYWTIPMAVFSRLIKSHSYITESLKKEVTSSFKLVNIPSVIWQSGVNTQIFRPDSSNRQASDQFNMLYHGTITHNRGIMTVVNAIKQLDNKYDHNFCFTIIGDGSGLKAIAQVVKEENLSHCIEIKGMLPYEEITEEINATDCCICPLPDRPEWNVSSPLKIFEYMACGKPMILTPIQAHTNILNNKNYVVWTDGYDVDSFENAILYAFSNRQQLVDNAQSAPELIKQKYTWNRHGNTLSIHLKSVLFPELQEEKILIQEETELI